LAKLAYPDRNSIEGAEVRLLLVECRGPKFADYTLEKATECMQLMDLVLYNRLLTKPRMFMAKGAKDIIDIIKGRGQFKGFESYPTVLSSITAALTQTLQFANDPKDPRHEKYAAFIQAAINVANSACIADASPGLVVFWRTAGSEGPGGTAVKYKTVGGNDFYWQPIDELM
jgi:hypothetical protein